ncbi:thrombopoietin receptor isoform X2 [Cygnus olor]|uniref:thrombopoietin receptor isoform X2 n=1 Tax=Cygnus olor TaxID=8869 RepID=UPI001ADE52C6|nr:thrombopoietin receptor isoform X2 [Cygnus olor]
MAACLPRGWLPSLLAVVLLSLRSPAMAPELVTSQDAALLEEVREDILCFSRSFEDLTCFWDEEEEASGMSHFYYWYSRDVPTACAVSTQRREAGGTRHVCAFPSQDVRLFTQLHVLVLDAATNQTRHQRELSVDVVGESLPRHNTRAPGPSLHLGPFSLPTRGWQHLVPQQGRGCRVGAAAGGERHGTFPAGLIAPPVNISARWAGATGQLHVSWQPPLPDYPNFFLYEVRYSAVSPAGTPHGTAWDPGKQHTGDRDPPTHLSSSTHPPTAGGAAASPRAGQGLVQADTWVVLQHLRPGVRYHIQARTKPDGTSMDGVWGPWSQAVAAETPHSSGDIGLCCSTPDLQHMRCEWSWDPAEHSSSHELFYQETPRGAGIREDMWQRCQEASVGMQGAHTCTFQPSNDSAVAVLVNVTRPHVLPRLSYFKEPFWLHQAVLTEAPQLVEAAVAQGQLSLQWLPPLEELAEQLDYQVRYAAESSPGWKVLQVPRAARGEVLDLRPGARYRAQVRARAGGPRYQGSWSAWSKPVVVDASADAGWIIPSVTVLPLVFAGALLGLRCTFPSLYSVKQRLWPPVPDLHRALGSFLHDGGKQGQAFYKQPPEEAVLPCLLEVLPAPPGALTPPTPEPAAGRPLPRAGAPSTDIANQSYLLVSGWEPRGPP